MLLQRLLGQQLISPPRFLALNTHYMCMMGSVAYGVSHDDSDVDLYGFCIPPKEDVFPHLRGEIPGFGRQKGSFGVWQEHHIQDPESGKEYDFQIYSIVRFFQLCMENNPNMIDALFVPGRCILHATAIGQRVREQRHLFLHKGCWHKLKGYAYSQLHKARSKSPEAGSKRMKLREQYGVDTKFLYHVYRLLSQGEEILRSGNLTLDEPERREVMQAIRQGAWGLEQVERYFSEREPELERLYRESSAIPHKPDEEKIKALLLECLSLHYGSLEGAVAIPGREREALQQIREIVERVL